MKRFLPLTLIAALALAGCGQPAKQRDKEPDAKPGITVASGRLVLPAVKGNPGAAYFDLANGSGPPAMLVAVSVQGAGKAEMHTTEGGAMTAQGPLPLPPGSSVRFEPGAKHVMVFDIADSAVAGGETEMTLTFADGDKVSAPLTIEAAGGDMEHMR
jgi:periplasmic copper chaperone A